MLFSADLSLGQFDEITPSALTALVGKKTLLTCPGHAPALAEIRSTSFDGESVSVTLEIPDESTIARAISAWT